MANKDTFYEKDRRMVMEIFENAKRNQSDFVSRINRWNDIYEAKNKQPLYQGLANTHVPELFKAIQTLLTGIMNYVTQSGIFSIRKQEEIKPEIVDACEKHFKEQMKKGMFNAETKRLLLNMLKNGMGIAKTFWRSDKKNIIKPVPIYAKVKKGFRKGEKILDEKGEPIIIDWEGKEYEETISYPYFKSLNLKNVYLIGETDSLKIMDYDGVMEFIDNVAWKELWDNRVQTIENEDGKEIEIGIYENLEHALEIGLLPTKGGKDEYDKKEVKSNEATYPKGNQAKTKKGKHSLVEYWTHSKFGGKWYPSIITVLDEKLVIRKEKNPFHFQEYPYLFCPLLLRENEAFGMGLMQNSEALQNELNSRNNQSLDNNTIALRHMWLVRDKSITKSQLTFRPFGAIYSSMGKDAIEPLQSNQIDAGVTLQQMDRLIDMIKTTTGATTVLQGASVSKRTTKSENQAMLQQSNFRVMDIMTMLEDFIFLPYLKRMLSMNRQFTEEETAVYIRKGDVNQRVVLSKKHFMFPYEFEIEVSGSVENKTVKTQQLQNYLGMLLKSTLPPGIILPGIITLMKRLWVYQNIGTPDEIITPEMEQQIKALAQKLRMQMLQAQPGQQPGQEAGQMPPAQQLPAGMPAQGQQGGNQGVKTEEGLISQTENAGQTKVPGGLNG